MGASGREGEGKRRQTRGKEKRATRKKEKKGQEGAIANRRQQKRFVLETVEGPRSQDMNSAGHGGKSTFRAFSGVHIVGQKHTTVHNTTS
jgi:hypothetical protein